MQYHTTSNPVIPKFVEPAIYGSPQAAAPGNKAPYVHTTGWIIIISDDPEVFFVFIIWSHCQLKSSGSQYFFRILRNSIVFAIFPIPNSLAAKVTMVVPIIISLLCQNCTSCRFKYLLSTSISTFSLQVSKPFHSLWKHTLSILLSQKLLAHIL